MATDGANAHLGKRAVSRKRKVSRKRPIRISNLTFSHALIESTSCYYEGPLPSIDFDLGDSDILIAPRRLIKCDHPGTLAWIQQFLVFLQYYVNYPPQRELVISNIIRQLPGNVYVLNEQNWDSVFRKDELFTLFKDIVEGLVEYQRNARMSVLAPVARPPGIGKQKAEQDQYDLKIFRRQMNTDSHRIHNDESDGSAQKHPHEYWTGLLQDYLLEKDVDRSSVEICENDVLLSQKALWKNHFGTVLFGRQIRQSLVHDGSPDQIAQNLIQSVFQRGGRFFEPSFTATSMNSWRLIENQSALLCKVRGFLDCMQRLDKCAVVEFPVDGVQCNDVVLSISPTFLNHHGTTWFVNIMMRLKKHFIKAEVGCVLARKVREEVVRRGGRFFSSKYDDPIASLKVEDSNARIELSIVRLLEDMETTDLKENCVEEVRFDYPVTEGLNPPPNHSDIFLGDCHWLTCDELETKPPGNIRLLRMVRDRCALCPQTDWTNEATDIIFRVISQRGRFLLEHQDTGWYVEKELPILLPLVISIFPNVSNVGSNKDTGRRDDESLVH
jgi:hypothetical protein